MLEEFVKMIFEFLVKLLSMNQKFKIQKEKSYRKFFYQLDFIFALKYILYHNKYF